MPYQPDLDAMAPVLELSIDYVSSSLRCAGTVDVRTGRHVVEAVEEMLTHVPPHINVDVRALHVADGAGADALRQVEKIVRGSGPRLRWRRAIADHVGGIVPMTDRAPRREGRASGGRAHSVRTAG